MLNALNVGASLSVCFFIRSPEMDISSFVSGNYLTHLDLPLPIQSWKISKVDQQLVGQDQKNKVCITFEEFPSKAFASNKTNLKRI